MYSVNTLTIHKRITGAVLALCFISSFSFSQTKVDSLWNRYHKLTVKDTASLGILHKIANENQNIHPDSLNAVAQLMLEEAKRLRSDKYIGFAYNHIGMSFMLTGRMEQAITNYSYAFPYLVKSGEEKNQAANLINRGSCFNQLSMSDSAIYYYKKGIALCDRIGEVNFKVNALVNIGVVHQHRGEYMAAIKQISLAVPLAKKINNYNALSGAYTNLGRAYSSIGQEAEALNFYDKALLIFEKEKNRQGEAFTLKSIGDVYNAQKEYEQAIQKYKLALGIMEQISDLNGKASLLLSMGNTYNDLGNEELSNELYREGLQIADEIGDARTAIIARNNLASYYQEEGELDSAQIIFNEVIEISRIIEAKQFETLGLINLGANYSLRGDNKKAELLLSEGLQLAKSLGDIQLQWRAAKSLVGVYTELNRPKDVLKMHNLYAQLLDSLHSDDNKNATLKREYKFAYEKQALEDSLLFEVERVKQNAEISRRKRTNYGLTGLLIFAVVFASIAISQRNRIKKEKKLSEELLHNILPEEVATELKATGEAEAKLIQNTTVLFTDFKGFTAIAAELGPKELVGDIHESFSAFDHIMERYNIEKIKTIGDAYMAAGGIPEEKTGSVKDVILAALDICKCIEEGKQKKESQGKPFFEVRVGIHTGPVVAGIVGVKKFQYDIWGDTVNTASRMESSGEVGRVNISQPTYDLIKDDPQFTFEHRGKVVAKGKGEVDMYFVELT